jgi:hypothetical protein
MIDRTTFDLRMAEHATTTATLNWTDWQRQGGSDRRPVRAALAGALVALATRLAPGQPATGPLGQSGQERPATA